MVNIGIAVLSIFGLGILVFIHYRSKSASQSKLMTTLGNASGVMSFIVAIVLVFLQFKSGTTPAIENFIYVTCSAAPAQTPDITEQQRRWLTKEAAELNCRAKLVTAIKSKIVINQPNSEINQKDIELKVNVALQLSEIVDGKFLPDGSYQMKMKAPRPVV